jgi:general L-amino acid transport system substrate-binding protein
VSFALVNAEGSGELENIDGALSLKTGRQAARWIEGNYGERMGLTNDWAARIIRLVGNYGEIYERNVGVGSPLGIPRGINQLWNKGGILYAPPIR